MNFPPVDNYIWIPNASDLLHQTTSFGLIFLLANEKSALCCVQIVRPKWHDLIGSWIARNVLTQFQHYVASCSVICPQETLALTKITGCHSADWLLKVLTAKQNYIKSNYSKIQLVEILQIICVALVRTGCHQAFAGIHVCLYTSFLIFKNHTNTRKSLSYVRAKVTKDSAINFRLCKLIINHFTVL